MTYCDAHCHISAKTLADYAASLEATGENFFVKRAVCCHIAEDWDRVGAFILQSPMPAMQHAVARMLFGYHPAFLTGAEDYALLEGMIQKHSSITIGEIGMDYTCPTPDRLQREAFVRQMEMASKLGLSVVLHAVKAHEDVLQILKDFDGVKKISLHAANCSAELAARYLERGVKFSLGLREMNSKKGEELARNLPLSEIMLETDSDNFDFSALQAAYEKLHSLRSESAEEVDTRLKFTFEKFFCDAF